MKRYNFFEEPKQVRWYDGDSGEYATGIAFGENIICSCCGGLMSFEEIYEAADEDNVQGIFVYNDWANLTDGIIGGDFEEEYKAGYFEQ